MSDEPCGMNFQGHMLAKSKRQQRNCGLGLIAIFLLSCSLSSEAGIATHQRPPANQDGINPIVTPDQATGFIAFERYYVHTDGDIRVCASPSQSSCFNHQHSSYKKLKDVVPAGKTFVGFRVVSGSYGTRMIEIYWK